MYIIIEVNPGDSILVSIGEDIDTDSYKSIMENLKHMFHTENIMIYPENMIKDINIIRREGCYYPNMFLGDQNDYLY